MASPIRAAYIEQFNEEVKVQYQDAGMLMEMVRMESADGEVHNFPVLGSIDAQRRTGSAEEVIPAGGEYTSVATTLQNIITAEYVDKFDQMSVNFDIMQYHAKNIAKAMGREIDSLIIEALNGATVTKTVAADVSGSTSNLTIESLIEAAGELNDDGVDDMDRCFAIGTNGLRGLLAQTEVSSADYNSIRALETGELNTYMGFTFKKIADNRTKGALPKSGDVRTHFAFHKDAVGLAVNTSGMETTVDRVAHRLSDLIVSTIKANAVVIDPRGVVKVLANEAN